MVSSLWQTAVPHKMVGGKGHLRQGKFFTNITLPINNAIVKMRGLDHLDKWQQINLPINYFSIFHFRYVRLKRCWIYVKKLQKFGSCVKWRNLTVMLLQKRAKKECARTSQTSTISRFHIYTLMRFIYTSAKKTRRIIKMKTSSRAFHNCLYRSTLGRAT